MSYFLDEEKTWLQRDFGLDRRLIKALSKLGFTFPTLVQAKCIPLVTQGKDVLVRAKTGAGKTIAFSLPILQKILSSKTDSEASIKCIILAPTKELIKQIEKHIMDLIYYCRESISLCSLSDDNASVQRYRLQSKPDIVISTPARLVQNIKTFDIDFSGTNTLVIDEADLVLSFGYTEDVHTIISKMPKIFQGVLMSATLSAELDKFKKVVLHNPAVLKLEEPDGTSNLAQYYLNSTEKDKFLILYVFMKLGLLQGKGLIFVNDVNKCYKLKLFFQQFFITTAVLNSEVPLNSRLHILEEFNRGVFDYLIATDASIDKGDQDDNEDNSSIDENDEEEEEEDNEIDAEDDEDGNNKKNKNGTKRSRASNGNNNTSGKNNNTTGVDYGVSRGIDFQNVNFVVNFDFPCSAAAYTHRIGRTARGGATGTALSFVASTQTPGSGNSTAATATIAECEAARRDQATLQEVRESQPRLPYSAAAANTAGANNALATVGATAAAIGDDRAVEQAEEDNNRMQPAPLQFNMKELDSFRYRVEDTLRSVTLVAVKELRSAELKREILNSEKLKSFFAENPNDLKVLRHDKAIAHPIRQKDHLKTVPDYLMPMSMRSVATIKTKNNKRAKKRSKTSASGGGGGAEQRVQQSKKKNPLYNLQEEGSNSGGDDGGNSSNNNTNTASSSSSSELKYYTTSETSSEGGSSSSMSGRKQWKMAHKKGSFNPKAGKRNLHRTPGSFIKSKNYK